MDAAQGVVQNGATGNERLQAFAHYHAEFGNRLNAVHSSRRPDDIRAKHRFCREAERGVQNGIARVQIHRLYKRVRSAGGEVAEAQIAHARMVEKGVAGAMREDEPILLHDHGARYFGVRGEQRGHSAAPPVRRGAVEFHRERPRPRPERGRFLSRRGNK